jgi:hypothetical protein
MKPGNLKKQVRIATFSLLLSLVVLTFPRLCPAAANEVNFKLKDSEAGPTIVDVELSFKMNEGQKAVLKPPEGVVVGNNNSAGLSMNMMSRSQPGFEVQPLEPAELGWIITALQSIEAKVSYRVGFITPKPVQGSAEGTEEGPLPRAIADPDLKAFKASDLLTCPLIPANSEPLTDLYSVRVELSSEDEVLSPWDPCGEEPGVFKVDGTDTLQENFLAWGDLDVRVARDSEPRITVGFSGDYSRLDDSEKKSYSDTIADLYSSLARRIGPGGNAGLLTVLCAGASRFGLSSPSSRTLIDSVQFFHGGRTLTGIAAAVASRGLFELWNRYVFVPDSSKDARWFQEGLPLFYPLRVASIENMMEATDAFGDFSLAYADYLTNPDALTLSLVDAGPAGDVESLHLLRTKGAAVIASIAERLWEETNGTRDMDWFIASMAEKYPYSQGKEYGLVDISEMLEEATDSSWDRFFSDKVMGTGIVDASEFSSTNLFGAHSSGTIGSEVETEGSGASWIYLVVAVVIIFLIPVIFTAYVRRSVKMDLAMPKILPDDEEEQQS